MSNPKGHIVANWYVFCNLCEEHAQHTRPRTTSFAVAKRHFRELGWKEGPRTPYMGGTIRHWVCPKCAENTRRFFDRSANQTAGWVKTLRKQP